MKAERIRYEELKNFVDSISENGEVMPFLTPDFSIVMENNIVLDLLKTNTPYLVEDARIMLILDGEAEVEANLQHYSMRSGDLVVASYGTIMNIHSVTPKYKVHAMMLSQRLLAQYADSSLLPFLVDGVGLTQFRLNDEEMSIVIKTLRTLWQVVQTYGYEKEIVQPMLRAYVMLVKKIWQVRQDDTTDKDKRQNSIFTEFLRLVNQHAAKEHTLDFYADSLCITHNYLSAVVKKTSGITAKEWIDKALITKAQVLLKTSNMQGAQVSYALSFPNPSFFNKFFKRHTGLTPKQYRES